MRRKSLSKQKQPKWKIPKKNNLLGNREGAVEKSAAPFIFIKENYHGKEK